MPRTFWYLTSSADSVARDVACLGAFITIVSVFFSAITQNVLGTYVSLQNGQSLDLVAGRVPRSEYFNLSDQPPDSELTFRKLLSIMRPKLSYHMLIYIRGAIQHRCISTCSYLQRHHLRQDR
jgi:hypothetical protein